ncbi:hypothetical protein FN846DRAFT_776022 [Sphaerosporella brunnea]|uniref:Alpha/Beta hydrolase protein n=1 Tax=Sphaerosporella brunnea TaxID=1250544 RepID=A0A5J5F1N2_9PEZI|nr:hypothetical protein FN846DRAFT_776022 [Sphaerosporella brunnea]
MAPRGKNTVFRATGIPLGEKADILLKAALADLSEDKVDEDSIEILKEALSSGTGGSFLELSDEQQARAFVRAAIRLELTEEERKQLKIGIEIIPCCYNHSRRSALVHFVGGDPKFTLDPDGEPREQFQIVVDAADISFDRHFCGFTQMYATEGGIVADVVAVTGLNGHSWGSWRGREKAGRMWLRDYLGQDLPQFRTMTYGYNSKLHAHNVDTILDYGLGFLEEIRKVRATNEEKERPLILMGHSFGGLLVAHSLVKGFIRKEDDPLYRATVGIIFFGVPHKGLVVADMKSMLQEKHPRQELLNQITRNSQMLANQLADFKNIIEDRKIVSFYERQQTGLLKQDPETGRWKRGKDDYSTAVDEESALLQFPDKMEVKIPVDADHSNMVKFDSQNNQTYSSVLGHLKAIASSSRGVVGNRFCA